MTRIAVIYDSHGGRSAALAGALADGAGPGARLARVPALDTVGPHLGPGGTLPSDAEATADTIAAADGIALVCPVHLGAPSAAMLAFLSRTGRLWQARGLAGRAGTACVAAGSGGGAETALVALWTVLASHGLVLVPGVPDAAEGPGGGPLGAVMAGGGDATALARARAQGARLADVAARLMQARPAAPGP